MNSQHFSDSSIPVLKILEQAPYIKVLVLFGSRARGDYHASSDWDFAVIYDEQQRKQFEKGGWDSFRLSIVIQQAMNLADEKLDVIDLGTCSSLLAHSVARDGVVLYEQAPGIFQSFRENHLKSEEELREIQKELRDRIHRRLQEWKQ